MTSLFRLQQLRWREKVCYFFKNCPMIRHTSCLLRVICSVSNATLSNPSPYFMALDCEFSTIEASIVSSCITKLFVAKWQFLFVGPNDLRSKLIHQRHQDVLIVRIDTNLSPLLIVNFVYPYIFAECIFWTADYCLFVHVSVFTVNIIEKVIVTSLDTPQIFFFSPEWHIGSRWL